MEKKSRLYTGGGDKGTTSLVGGERVPKYHVRLECYGTLDELNSFVGLLLSANLLDEDVVTLTWIQHKLFSLGSYLATDNKKTDFVLPSRIGQEEVERLEKEIDKLDSSMPRMVGFVLPSGIREAALAHVCRTVCRRAERQVYRLINEGGEVEEDVLKYINRLSDYFFVLARKESLRINGEEIIWDQSC